MAARIFELIAHFELGNTDLAGSLLRSCYRYFNQRGNLNEFEKIMINAMRSLIKINKPNDRKETLVSLKNELVRIKNDPLQKNSMDHFDYLRWLNDKI